MTGTNATSSFFCSAGCSGILAKAGRPIEIAEIVCLQLGDEPEHHLDEADRDFTTRLELPYAKS